MQMKNREYEIVQLALQTLRENLPRGAEFELTGQISNEEGGKSRLLHLEIGKKKRSYQVEVKTCIGKSDIGMLLLRKDRVNKPVLLITWYIDRKNSERLRKAGLQFIDTAGNAYIYIPPVYIYIKGSEPPSTFERPVVGRAFQAKGLRVIYAFLANPGLEDESYREIASETNVSLGSVGWLMKELKELGYLLDLGKKGNRLIRKKELLNRWVTSFPEKLKPKLFIGRFEQEMKFGQSLTLDPMNGQFGGEIAASMLTGGLKPRTTTIYTVPQSYQRVLFDNRLRKSPDGDIEVYEKFWGSGIEQVNPELVHPILIYADLVASGDQRNIETAESIYEQYIVRLIGEN